MASCQEAVTEVEMQAVGERERKGWKDLSDILELLLCDISAGWLGGGKVTVFNIFSGFLYQIILMADQSLARG